MSYIKIKIKENSGEFSISSSEDIVNNLNDLLNNECIKKFANTETIDSVLSLELIRAAYESKAPCINLYMNQMFEIIDNESYLISIIEASKLILINLMNYSLISTLKNYRKSFFREIFELNSNEISLSLILISK